MFQQLCFCLIASPFQIWERKPVRIITLQFVLWFATIYIIELILANGYVPKMYVALKLAGSEGALIQEKTTLVSYNFWDIWIDGNWSAIAFNLNHLFFSIWIMCIHCCGKLSRWNLRSLHLRFTCCTLLTYLSNCLLLILTTSCITVWNRIRSQTAVWFEFEKQVICPKYPS